MNLLAGAGKTTPHEYAVRVIAKEWFMSPAELEWGLENLGWSQWFLWAAEILSLENDEIEWRRKKAERATRR